MKTSINTNEKSDPLPVASTCNMDYLKKKLFVRRRTRNVHLTMTFLLSACLYAGAIIGYISLA